MDEEVIIYGAGGHARSCIQIIDRDCLYKIYGVVGTNKEIGNKILDYEISFDDFLLKQIYKKCSNMIYAIGGVEKNSQLDRRKKIKILQEMNFKFPVLRSQSSLISKNVSILEGAQILDRVTINTDTKIGKFTIINNHSLIDHDCNIGDYCNIATGVIINGGVNVGSSTFIGSGSIIRNGINIGSNCYIGMGQKVVHDLSDNKIIC